MENLDVSPARGRTLGSCSVSSASLFLVDKQDRSGRHGMTPGVRLSERLAGSGTGLFPGLRQFKVGAG